MSIVLWHVCLYQLERLIFFAGKYMTVMFVSENVRQIMELVDVSLRCAAVSFVFLSAT